VRDSNKCTVGGRRMIRNAKRTSSPRYTETKKVALNKRLLGFSCESETFAALSNCREQTVLENVLAVVLNQVKLIEASVSAW